jgi:hypothetical protein
LFEGGGALIAIVIIDRGVCHDAREDGRTVGVRVDGYPAGRARRRPEDEFVERGLRGGPLEARVPCPCSFGFTSFIGSGMAARRCSEVKLFARKQLIVP